VSKNTNCLEGIRCPKCGQDDSLRIAGSSIFTVVDDGTEDHGDVEWDEDSWALCPACEYEGKLGMFHTDE
jgi:Zn ribbon nucleic-acid-binding protein